MSKYEVMAKFEEQVLLKALEHIDQDALAKQIASKIKKTVKENVNQYMLENLDISEWVKELLEDERTKAGKEFSKAMDHLAAKMAKSLIE